jgi:hypothetical protein
MNYIIFGAGNKIVEDLIIEISNNENSNIILIDEELNEYLEKYASLPNCIVIIGNILNDGFVFVKLDIQIKELFNGKIDYIYNFTQYKENYNSIISKSPLLKTDEIKYLDKCTIGIKNIAMFSNDYNAKFIQISDKIEENVNIQNSYYKYGNLIAEKYLYEIGWYIYNTSNQNNVFEYYIYRLNKNENNIGKKIIDFVNSDKRIN